MKYFKLFEQFVTENNQPVNEAREITRSFDGFIVTDHVAKKNYKFRYVKGVSATKTEAEAIEKIAKKTGHPSSEFSIGGFLGRNEWDQTPMAVIESVNEASKFYTLEDMIDDNKGERDLQKAAAMCAVTLGLDPKEVAIVTTEDDVYDKYQSKYKSSKFAPFNNPSADMSTAYAKGDNVITFNDGNVSGFFIPVESMNESVVNEAPTNRYPSTTVTAIDAKKMTAVAKIITDTELFPELDGESVCPKSMSEVKDTIDVIVKLPKALAGDYDSFGKFLDKMADKYGADQVIWMNAENADQIEDSKLNSVFSELEEALSDLDTCFAEFESMNDFAKAYNRLAKAVDKVLAATK
jgi:hypothetical protein